MRLSPSGELGDPEVFSSVPPSSVRRIQASGDVAHGFGSVAVTIAHGSCETQPYTPSDCSRFNGMLLSRLAFAAGSAVDPEVFFLPTSPLCEGDLSSGETTHAASTAVRHRAAPACRAEGIRQASPADVGRRGHRTSGGRAVSDGLLWTWRQPDHITTAGASPEASGRYAQWSDAALVGHPVDIWPPRQAHGLPCPGLAFGQP